MSAELNADVVVVGAGMAGLVAAVSVLEAGRSVVVLEKGTRYGGTMWLSSGLIWTFRNRTQVQEEIPDGDASLQELVVEQLPAGLQWLEERGVQLQSERDFMWYGRGRPSDTKQMTLALVERIRGLGGQVLLRTPMQALRTDEGAITGVRAMGPDGEVVVNTSAVILATGGFQGNAELLQQWVTPYADQVYLRANPWSTGDGLLAAKEVGAALSTGLSRFYGHAIAAPPTRFTEAEFQAAGQRYGPLALALNLDGQRFTDESAGTGEEHLNAEIARQRGATAALVVDADAAERSYYGGPTARSRIEWLRDRGGPVIQADTVEDLCDGMAAWGIPPAISAQTIHEFNNAMQSEPARAHPPRTRHREPHMKPPFSAVLVRPGITFTAGGLAVDQEMNVLRRQSSMTVLPLVSAPVTDLFGEGIPGLYATGCDVGGFSTDNYMGGLAVALVSARIASAAAVSHLDAAEPAGTGRPHQHPAR